MRFLAALLLYITAGVMLYPMQWCGLREDDGLLFITATLMIIFVCVGVGMWAVGLGTWVLLEHKKPLMLELGQFLMRHRHIHQLAWDLGLLDVTWSCTDAMPPIPRAARKLKYAIRHGYYRHVHYRLQRLRHECKHLQYKYVYSPLIDYVQRGQDNGYGWTRGGWYYQDETYIPSALQYKGWGISLIHIFF